MKKIIIISTIIVLIIVVFFAFTKINESSTKPSPTPGAASWTGIIPGQTTTKDATKILGTPIASSGNILDFQSKSPTENNKITSENGKVIFIRHVIAKGDNTSTTQITDLYGTAPVRLYGPDSNGGEDLYVYPEKGVAYLANQPKEYMFEIWYFEPMGINNFIKKWAPSYSSNPNNSGY